MNRRLLREVVGTLAVIFFFVSVVIYSLPAESAERSIVVQPMPHTETAEAAVLAEFTAELAALHEQVVVLQKQVADAEQAGIFRRPKEPTPDPGNPNAPKTPTEPPQFEFPTVPGEPDGEEAGLKDWTPEQWSAFFEKLIGIITMLIGLFGGSAAAGAFKRQ